MMTITVFSIVWYSPLAISWEKRPDPSSPTRVEPFTLVALLSSSEEGMVVVSMLKVRRLKEVL
jgi:hypothetical protein